MITKKSEERSQIQFLWLAGCSVVNKLRVITVGARLLRSGVLAHTSPTLTEIMKTTDLLRHANNNFSRHGLWYGLTGLTLTTYKHQILDFKPSSEILDIKRRAGRAGSERISTKIELLSRHKNTQNVHSPGLYFTFKNYYFPTYNQIFPILPFTAWHI